MRPNNGPRTAEESGRFSREFLVHRNYKLCAAVEPVQRAHNSRSLSLSLSRKYGDVGPISVFPRSQCRAGSGLRFSSEQAAPLLAGVSPSNPICLVRHHCEQCRYVSAALGRSTKVFKPSIILCYFNDNGLQTTRKSTSILLELCVPVIY